VGVKFPRATRPLILTLLKSNLAHNVVGGQVNAVKKPPLTRPSLVNGGRGNGMSPILRPFNFQDTLESIFLSKRKTTTLGMSRLD
jgi:hypothetical protein